MNIGPRSVGLILEENVRVLKEVGQKLKKERFPRLSTKDYMRYRDSAKQERSKEKGNYTVDKVFYFYQIVIYLGEKQKITGFRYLPRAEKGASGQIRSIKYISDDFKL